MTTPHRLPVEVLGLKSVEGVGNLRALASIRSRDLTVHCVRVVQQPGQRAWESLPQNERLGFGRTRYFPVLELPDQVMAAISEAVLVLEEWSRYGR